MSLLRWNRTSWLGCGFWVTLRGGRAEPDLASRAEMVGHWCFPHRRRGTASGERVVSDDRRFEVVSAISAQATGRLTIDGSRDQPSGRDMCDAARPGGILPHRNALPLQSPESTLPHFYSCGAGFAGVRFDGKRGRPGLVWWQGWRRFAQKISDEILAKLQPEIRLEHVV